MSEANQTIFNNWKQFIYNESLAIIEKVLSDQKYDSLHSKQWVNSVCEQIIGKLSATNKNFKYVVNCVILAAESKGMDVGGLCYWDSEMDGSVTIKYESKTLTAIANVYGCAVN